MSRQRTDWDRSIGLELGSNWARVSAKGKGRLGLAPSLRPPYGFRFTSRNDRQAKLLVETQAAKTRLPLDVLGILGVPRKHRRPLVNPSEEVTTDEPQALRLRLSRGECSNQQRDTNQADTHDTARQSILDRCAKRRAELCQMPLEVTLLWSRPRKCQLRGGLFFGVMQGILGMTSDDMTLRNGLKTSRQCYDSWRRRGGRVVRRRSGKVAYAGSTPVPALMVADGQIRSFSAMLRLARTHHLRVTLSLTARVSELRYAMAASPPPGGEAASGPVENPVELSVDIGSDSATIARPKAKKCLQIGHCVALSVRYTSSTTHVVADWTRKGSMRQSLRPPCVAVVAF
jgi:hypothetical protein